MDVADLVHPAEELMADPKGAPAVPSSPARGAVTSWLKRLAREPLTHFVLVGALLTAAGETLRHTHDAHRIVITPAHVESLANAYALQFGQRPDAKTLQALVRSDAQDEILFREGEALGLDRGDEIVRRRVVQKMQFLMQDVSAPAEPTEADLRAFWRAHGPRYALAPRTSFSHIFFSSDQGGDAAALARARATLAGLPPGLTRAPDRGDPFPDLFDFAAYEPEQIARVFGRTEFTERLATAPPGRWSGPFRSSYGWHLVYVSHKEPGGPAPFADVRDRVRTDVLEAAAAASNRAAFERLAGAYTVIVGGRDADGARGAP